MLKFIMQNSIHFSFLALTATTLWSSRAGADTQALSPTEFIKIRCNTTADATLTSWQGSVTTTGISTDKARTLFKIDGFNIARCLKDENGDWVVTSRELTFYRDPQSGEVLHNWLNPWTGETLPVVHIANALVQQTISTKFPLKAVSSGQTSIVRIDVPLSYPNPLAGDERFKDFSPESFYKAQESFTYVLSRKDLENIATVNAINDVQVSWTRVSPWLPWMRMKGASGYLVFDALVKKHLPGEGLPEALQKAVSVTDLSLYLDAPNCVVKNSPNVTSWSYFRTHFEAYLRGDSFPRPESAALATAECP